MFFQITEELKNKLEDVKGLDPAVSKIIVKIQTNESDETEVDIAVCLISTFEMNKPSKDIGRKLNAIASEIRARSSELPVPPAISFFKEEIA